MVLVAFAGLAIIDIVNGSYSTGVAAGLIGVANYLLLV